MVILFIFVILLTISHRGIPKSPTIIAVAKFKPIWKLNAPPIKFIINISPPPKIEFNISLLIAFNGTENIFPIIQKTAMHPKIINIFVISKFYHYLSLFLLINNYDKIWTNITYTTWFFLK